MGCCCRPFKYETGNDEFFIAYKAFWDNEYDYDNYLKPHPFIPDTDFLILTGKLRPWRYIYDYVMTAQIQHNSAVNHLQKILDKQKLNGGVQLEIKEKELNEYRERTLARVEAWKVKWGKYPDSLKRAILSFDPNCIDLGFGIVI